MKNGWKHIALREVLRLDLDRVNLEPGKPYDMVGVYSFGRGLFDREPVFGDKTSYRYFYRLKPDHIVMSQLFGWEGALALSSKNFAGKFLSPQFPTFLCDSTRLDRGFLGWLMRRPAFWQELGTRTSGMGDRRRTLNPEALFTSEIPLPPVTEQRRIVARIEQLAARIEEARRLRHQADEEAEALLPSARSSCISELMEKHGGEPLGELISMASGEGLTSSEMDDSFEYPVYGGGGLNGRYSRYLFEESRIAIGRVGARCGCVFVTEPKSWITDNALYLTKFSDRLDQKFLVHALSNLDLRQQANQAAQPVVSQKKINPMEIPVPPLPEQRRIVGYLDGLAGQVAALARLQSETAAELDALLPSVLDKAFKGEL